MTYHYTILHSEKKKSKSSQISLQRELTTCKFDNIMMFFTYLAVFTYRTSLNYADILHSLIGST